MTKNKNNVYYIIAAVVVVVIIAVLLARKPAETPAEEPVVVVEPEVETEVVLPEAETPTEYAGDLEMVTQAACVDGVVSGKITNVGLDTVVLGKDMKILLRGLVVKDAECDATELAPGESTTCMKLNGGFPVVSGQNEVLITLGAENGIATVNC